MAFLQYFTTVIVFRYFCIEKSCGITIASPLKINKRMCYVIPKFNLVKHRTKRSKNGRGVAMAFLQYFMTVLAFGYFRIEKIYEIQKKGHPKGTTNERVTLYQNITQSNTVETNQKTGEVLVWPFRTTS